MIALWILMALAAGAVAQNTCNPLTSATCPPIRGLPNVTHSVDFTKQTSLPEGWILADYANVTFGPEGATFWFNQRGNAPYIWTDFYLAYGTVDVELQVSNGTGVITSSVLFADDQDEIDWEFSGSNFATPSGKAFTNYFGKGITGNYDRATMQDVVTPQKSFHTYSFDWTPQRLRWIIDGSEKAALVNNGQITGDYQYPQTPARLHIGVWDAGDPNTAAGTVNWAGGYTNYSNVPYHAIVRSVNISTPFPCASWQYPTNFSGRWSDVRCNNDTVIPSATRSTQSSSTRAADNLCTASVYTVHTGDYGYGIAQKFDIDFNALNSSNPLVNWNDLTSNQVLNLPCGISTNSGSTSSSTISQSPAGTSIAMPGKGVSSASTMFLATSEATNVAPSPTSTSTNVTSTVAPSCATTSYMVYAGDYGYGIAAKLGVSFSNLRDANPDVDWNNLRIQQLLSVPCGPATASSTPLPQTAALATTVGTPSALSQYAVTSTSARLMLLLPNLVSSAQSSSSNSASYSSTSLSSTSATLSQIHDSPNSVSASTIALPSNWKYKSCVTDNLVPRSLNVTSTLPKEQINTGNCIRYCDSQGYVLAGTEWRQECYCGMQLFNSTAAPESECNYMCYANMYEMCGGWSRLSLYYKETNSSMIGNCTTALSTTASVGNLAQSTSTVPSKVSSTTRYMTDAPPSTVVQANVIGLPLLTSVNTNSTTLLTTSPGTSDTTSVPISTYASISVRLSTATTTPPTASSSPGSLIDASSSTAVVSVPSGCVKDNCLRLMRWLPSSASSIFAAYSMSSNRPAIFPATIIASACGNDSTRISSACNCMTTRSGFNPSSSSTGPATSTVPSASSVLSSSSHSATLTTYGSMNMRGGSTWSNWRKRDGKDYRGDIKADGHVNGMRLHYAGHHD